MRTTKKKIKILHIIFKSTNCVDYIYPYYYSKTVTNKYSLEFLIWDPHDLDIKTQLPSGFGKFKVKKLSDFFKLNHIFRFKKKYLKLIHKIFDFDFLFKKKLLEKYVLSFDHLYLDSKSFESFLFNKTILKIINKNNKKIYLVPHGPHYRTSHGEAFQKDLQFIKNPNLILSNKFSNPWIKDIIDKKKCSYFGFPTNNKSWKLKIKKLQKNKISKKTIGFIFRPFIKKKSKAELINRDYYINSYEENILMINIAKFFYQKDFKILFRLHPSSLENDFKNYYGKHLNKINFRISKGSIHNFYLELNSVISFHSTALIYGGFYNKKIFLLKNDLERKIYKKWKNLKKIYNSFCIEFYGEQEIKKLFFKKIKLNKSQSFKKFW